jgi:hypothetical protein
MEGLLVSNPFHEDIGYPVADNEGPWKPVNGKKMVVCGLLNNYFVYKGSGDEYDWNLEIIPALDFKYIIEHPRRLVEDKSNWKTCERNGFFYDCFQAEITPDETLFENDWFPDRELEFNGSLKPEWLQADPIALNQNVCVYGAWVLDGGHTWRPEIHPTEAIWWRNRSEGKDEYFVFGIQDDSDRYDDPGDFEFDQDFGVRWRPWAKAPIVTQIKIPFEYDGTFSDHPVITIEEELKVRHQVLIPNQGLGDSDSGTNHQLKFQDKKLIDITQPSNILVEVNEQVSNPGLLDVRFSDICRRENGNIIGYVQVTTAYGKDSDGKEGYHVLKITITHPSKKVEQPVIINEN